MKFYDTSSLLTLNIGALNEEVFVLSSITLKELEEIKNSKNKSEEIKIQARFLTKWLLLNYNKYEVIIFKNQMLEEIQKLDLPINNDTKILASAIFCDKELYPDNLEFITNDLSLFNIANLYFGNDSIDIIEENKEEYKGYKEVQLSDCEMADFYSSLNQNKYSNYFDLLVNEYLILKNNNNEIIDLFKWTGNELKYLKYDNFNSNYFGKIKPQDIYQKLAFDSLINNKITMLKGPAGSGKTYTAIGYLISQLEKHKIDKIIVFCNTVATKNSARLGLIMG